MIYYTVYKHSIMIFVMSELVEHLKQKQWLWQGSNTRCEHEVITSGFEHLDAQLNGGFPRYGAVEIQSASGIGELRLLLPHLCASASNKAHTNRLMVFIQPPGILSIQQLTAAGISANNVIVIAPQNEQHALWAAEQCAKSGACSHVLFWPHDVQTHQARRLQVASETGQCLQFLFCHTQTHRSSLPVSLSLTLHSSEQGLAFEINKRKGGWQHGRFTIDMQKEWPDLVLKPRRSVVVPFHQAKQG